MTMELGVQRRSADEELATPDRWREMYGQMLRIRIENASLPVVALTVSPLAHSAAFLTRS